MLEAKQKKNHCIRFAGFRFCFEQQNCVAVRAQNPNPRPDSDTVPYQSFCLPCLTLFASGLQELESADYWIIAVPSFKAED